MEKVRFGIIGVGNMGTTHAKNLLEGKVENGELGCLCDISAERREIIREKFPNVPIFSNVDEVIASGLVDAILVEFVNIHFRIEQILLSRHLRQDFPRSLKSLQAFSPTTFSA